MVVTGACITVESEKCLGITPSRLNTRYLVEAAWIAMKRYRNANCYRNSEGKNVKVSL
jgi:hypothetical protein